MLETAPTQSIRPLETQFERSGFHHRQVKRVGNVAIFRRNRIGSATVHHFEVIRVLSHKGYTIHGNVVPPSEFYPNSEDWGLHGFTYKTIEESECRFKTMTEQESK